MRRLDFVSLQVRDLDTSRKFYMEKLGFELSELKNPEVVIFKFNKGPIMNTPFGKALPVEDPNGYTLTFLEKKNII